jgi:hypothetical protein
MPYEGSKDPYATNSGPTMRGKFWSAPLAANATDFSVYPKALTVFVPSGTAGPHVSLRCDVVDAPLAVSLPEGLTVIDWCIVRAVTAITAGVVVRRVDD